MQYFSTTRKSDICEDSNSDDKTVSAPVYPASSPNKVINLSASINLHG